MSKQPEITYALTMEQNGAVYSPEMASQALTNRALIKADYINRPAAYGKLVSLYEIEIDANGKPVASDITQDVIDELDAEFRASRSIRNIVESRIDLNQDRQSFDAGVGRYGDFGRDS